MTICAITGLLPDRDQKWSLSPAHDINPAPDEGVRLKTAISEIHGNVPDIAKPIEASVYFDLTGGRRPGTGDGHGEYRRRARELKMGTKDVSRIAPAFENAQMAQAIALANTRTMGCGG